MTTRRTLLVLCASTVAAIALLASAALTSGAYTDNATATTTAGGGIFSLQVSKDGETHPWVDGTTLDVPYTLPSIVSTAGPTGLNAINAFDASTLSIDTRFDPQSSGGIITPSITKPESCAKQCESFFNNLRVSATWNGTAVEGADWVSPQSFNALDTRSFTAPESGAINTFTLSIKLALDTPFLELDAGSTALGVHFDSVSHPQ